MGIDFATIAISNEELIPEQLLWRGVLVNAIEDTLITQSFTMANQSGPLLIGRHFGNTSNDRWFKGKMDNWMFGCDVCQEVCPWNRFAEKHKEKAFDPHSDLLTLTKEDWEDLSNDVFTRVLGKSAVERVGFEGLKRTIQYLSDK
jgi:hypothetical protein